MMFQWSGECVIVHYLRIQAVCNTLPHFLSLLYHCGGVALFLIMHFTSSFASIRISDSGGEK